MYNNLQEFIERLEREGELLRIKTAVDTQYEIAEICDRVSKSADGGKALLFENTGTNFPLIINMLGSEKRMAMLCDVERLDLLTERIDSLLRSATSPMDSIWDKLKMLPLLTDIAKWVPKKSAARGECQAIVLQGDDIDLEKLPILKCWGFDGGRFITLPMVNTVSADSGARNTGMYRMQVLDKKTTAMHWHIHKTGARHYEEYKRRGEKMPIAVAIGGDPTYTYAATAPMPDNLDEYLLAGFLRKKSVKLVKCITNDIYVPADCDFVLEGYVDPAEEKIIEGPFGDHTGFYSLQDYYPKFHITAITHRRNAIYPATIVGIPPQEDSYIAIATERIFVSPIRFAMNPEVRDLYMPAAGTAHNIAITSIESRYAGQAQKVILSMWGAGQMMFNKYLAITQQSVDIRSEDEMAHLLRNVELKNCVMEGRGVLDVLDHATQTNGLGGKLALDLTAVASLPRTLAPKWNEQIEGVDTHLLDKWGAMIIRIAPEEQVALEELYKQLQPIDINYIILFDKSTANLSDYDLLWLAAANSEPSRDVKIIEGVMLVDARSKVPGRDDNPRRFPNVVTSRPEVVERVDRRWAEYSIGEFIESPSRKYRALELSEKEDW